jgi:hypothetical protein
MGEPPFARRSTATGRERARRIGITVNPAPLSYSPLTDLTMLWNKLAVL